MMRSVILRNLSGYALGITQYNFAHIYTWKTPGRRATTITCVTDGACFSSGRIAVLHHISLLVLIVLYIGYITATSRFSGYTLRVAQPRVVYH